MARAQAAHCEFVGGSHGPGGRAAGILLPWSTGLCLGGWAPALPCTGQDWALGLAPRPAGWVTLMVSALSHQLLDGKALDGESRAAGWRQSTPGSGHRDTGLA